MLTIRELHKKLGAIIKVKKELGDYYLITMIPGSKRKSILLNNIYMPPVILKEQIMDHGVLVTVEEQELAKITLTGQKKFKVPKGFKIK